MADGEHHHVALRGDGEAHGRAIEQAAHAEELPRAQSELLTRSQSGLQVARLRRGGLPERVVARA